MRARKLKGANGAIQAPDDVALRISEMTGSDFPPAGDDTANHVFASFGQLFYCDGFEWRPIVCTDFGIYGGDDYLIGYDNGDGNFVTISLGQGLSYDESTDTLSAPGQVFLSSSTFSSASSKSIDDVFSTDYTNYKVVINIDSSSASAELNFRFRVGGSDNSGASDYSYAGQHVKQSATATDYGNLNDDKIKLFPDPGSAWQDAVIELLIAQPIYASTRSLVTASGSVRDAGAGFYTFQASGVRVSDASHDGFTIFPNTGTISGLISVYGLS